MSHRILVIGAGQLGSRHLQGLARSCLNLRIDVVDTSPDALALARSRFEEMAAESSTAVYHTALPLGQAYDAAMIATASGPRAAVTEVLLTGADVGAILFEKVLFTRLEDYRRIGELLRAKGIPAWVNCPRRLYPFYRDLLPDLAGPVRIVMQGGMWGLGCNSIHIVDLASWLCGENAFTWDASGLDSRIHESSRAGYLEFSGALTAVSTGGSSVHLYAKADSAAPPQINILGENAAALIDEVHGHAAVYRKKQQFAPEHHAFRLPYQSELSHLVVEEILQKGSCALPDYDASARLHVGMIEAFQGHLKCLGYDATTCPVT